MTRDDLIRIFNEAKENKQDICIEVTIPNQEDTEYIINKNKSIDNKLDYYCKAYDNNLVHSMNDRIRIVNIYAIDFYLGD